MSVMMRSKVASTLAFAALCGLVCTVACAAEPQSAPRVQEYSAWTEYAPDQIQAKADKSRKQQIVIVGTRHCHSCRTVGRLFVRASLKNRDIEVVLGRHNEWGIPSELVPFVLVVTPICGITRRDANYSPSKLSAVEYWIDNMNKGEAFQDVVRLCKGDK